MSLFPEEAIAKNAFLGGALELWQPVKGYRAGVDPVLLAAWVPAAAGQAVLDLGCGAGAASLCLAARVPDLLLHGVEKHPGYAALARRNGAGAGLVVHEADLTAMPAELKALSFDHVIANPPYFDRESGTAAPDPARETALGEDVPLKAWVKAAAKRLKPRGYLHMILKADRLAHALAATQAQLGSLEVQPLAPRTGRDASLILLRSRKEGRALLKLHAPIVLHSGVAHVADIEDYTAEIAQVLRAPNPLCAK